MSDTWDERKKSLEEEYFRRKEQEAIEKLRAQRAEEGQAAAALQCPKCDGTLVVVVYEDVRIDRCNKCNGVWLDAGELEQLTQQEKHHGWLGRMWQGLSGQ